MTGTSSPTGLHMPAAIARLPSSAMKILKPKEEWILLQTLQREIKRSVIKIKKRLAQTKTIRAELRIQSSINRMEYRLMFRRKHARDLGDFYLASAGRMIRMHEVLLYYLLKNIRKGNYRVFSALTALEDPGFKKRLHIYSTGPFKQKGEIRQ